jgi:toxin secretion/phage lysis holin
VGEFMLNQVLLFTKEQTFVSSFITLIAYVYGLVSTPLFWALVIFSNIDYILGVYAAFKNKELNWNKCLDGIANKVFIGVLVLVSAVVDYALLFYGINTQGIFHNFIMAALMTRELGSIIKNAEKANFWVPQLLKDARQRLSDFSKGNDTKYK